jgi:hypothetical protein
MVKAMNKRLRYSITMLVIGLVISCGLAYVIFSDLGANFLDTITRNVCESTYPPLVEAVADIKLPPSATHLKSSCRAEKDWAEAYFDMKPSDLDVFVNSTNIKLPLSITGKPDKLECIVCNRLTDLKSYLYGTYRSGERFEEIFIDTSNPAQWRVYFTLLAG